MKQHPRRGLAASECVGVMNETYHLDPEGKNILVMLSGKLYVPERHQQSDRAQNWSGNDSVPKWSPDGKKIAYVARLRCGCLRSCHR